MATQAVHNYLKSQNRPYSANDILSSLKDHGKSAIQKALDSLVANGKVFEKINEKQKVYCIVQEMKQSTEELMKMNKELEAHANEVEKSCQELEGKIKKQQVLLAELKTSLGTKDLIERRDQLQESNKALNEKVERILGSSSKDDLPEMKRNAEKVLENYRREYVKRKRMCSEVMDNILENYPGKKAKFYEEVGIDPKIVS